MSMWPRMQFLFYGVTSSGVLVGDATEIEDFDKWAKVRNIDISGQHPFGQRPVPSYVETSYRHDVGYLLQKDVDTFFD